MANKIQIKRGLKASLPALNVGEPALCTDTEEVFIGGNSRTIQLATGEKSKHTNLLSKAYQKLNKKQDMTIVCQGTSLTYGQDTTSSGVVSASGSTDNGVAHTLSHASLTIPNCLQTYLRDIYNNNSIVINKGYSGDWAEASYNHWNINSNADIAFIELGTNDSNLGATWVPSDIKGNIDKYLESMRKIIKRYISWGTAVILLTPLRLKMPETPTTTTSWNTEPYRHALMILGDEFGCPVVDSETFLNGCDETYYSDDVHLNSKGYQYIASRLVSLLIGYGIKNPLSIKHGDNMSVRQTRDNVVTNGCYIEFSENSEGSEEYQNGKGILCNMSTSGEVFYGFETKEDNLILIPIYVVDNASIKIDLDFSNEQGSIPILSGANSTIPQGVKPLPSITSSTSTANENGVAWDGTIDISTTDRYIWITNKGWHNLKVTNGSGSGNIYFNGFVVMSFKDFIAQSKLVLFQKLLYNAYTGTPSSVTHIDITTKELNSFFTGNKLLPGGEYWRGIPLKVTLHNYSTNIIEYGFIWHDKGTGFTPEGGYYSWPIKQTDLIGSPTGFRTITGITYDSVNRKYVVNFGGNTSVLSSITIDLL